MGGPRQERNDGDPAELDESLLDVRLEYPPVLSHGSPAVPAQSPAGGGAKTITPKDVSLKDLGAYITFGAVSIQVGRGKPKSSVPRYLVSYDEEIIGYSQVYFKDATGAEQPWPESKIKTMFGGKDHPGSSMFTFDAPSRNTPVPILFQAEVYEPAKRRWRFQEIHKAEIQGYCAANLGALTAEERVFAKIIFAEGGSTSTVPAEELHAIAWAMRNRVDLIKRAVDSGSQALTDMVQRNFKTTKPTYDAVVNAPGQLTGVASDEFGQASDPANLIPTRGQCDRLRLCASVAREVIAGTIPDPYAGQGDPDFPGCFYYILKELRAQMVKNGNLKPTWNRPAFPAIGSDDRHWYYPMLPKGQR